MNLSNRLTFSIFFSVVLVALFALATTPALAITTVTAQVTEIVPNDSSADPVVQGKKVVTIKYSENADPAPVITGPDNTNTPDDDDTDPDVLAVTKVDSKTYTLTFLGPTDGTGPAAIPTLTLTGYEDLSGLDAHDDTADPPTNVVVQFVLSPNMLGGKGFAIIATYYDKGGTGAQISSSNGAAVDVSAATDGSYPTLPANINSGSSTDLTDATRTAGAVVRRDWNDHYDDAETSNDLMPDLWAHFQQGQRGTLDLTVTTDGMDPADDASNRAGDVNARTVRINEVMWARDESQVGLLGHTREQWIEIYNTKTTPVAFANIRFTLETHTTSPASTNASTDRLSTYPDFITAWDITDKGQDGHPGNVDGTGKTEFISMHRTNGGDGWKGGHWGKAGDLFLPNFRGTPGTANKFDTRPGARPATPTVTPAKDKIVINEIGKSSTAHHDWIELKNVTGNDQSLKGWSLTYVTGIDAAEVEIIDFGNNDKVLANGHLLLLNSHPDTNKHIRGFDIRTAVGDQMFGVTESSHRYLVVGGNKISIPSDNNWMLILRTNADNKFHKSSHNIHDVAGPGGGQGGFIVQDRNVATPRKDDDGGGGDGKGAIWHTRVWPLNGQNDANKDKLLRHTHAANAIPLGVDNKVWTRNTGKQGFAHGAFSAVGYTGVGYDRSASKGAVNGGTPGFPNDSVKSKPADIGGKLIVSELMLNNDGGRAPQWIELQNTSTTHGINFGDPDGGGALKPWRIEFENHNSGPWKDEGRKLNVAFNLTDLFANVPPGQTLLIVSTKVRGNALSDADHFPDHRVASIEDRKKSDFGLKNKRDIFLNAEGGFTITIRDSEGNISDQVGNLDGLTADVRKGIPIDDPYGWDWPTALAPDDSRTSLLRLKNKDGTPRAGTPIRPVPAVPAVEDDPATDADESMDAVPAVEANIKRGAVAPLGSLPNRRGPESAWVHAVDTDGAARKKITYYGDADDYSTPLYATGAIPTGVLPVNLSFFRPSLEDGKVVIRWTTESELDNAGFNILRSDSRNGEFKQVNDKMIQGKGTTAERSTYKWVDTSAKPGAIYYYQIEDVSFAGERTTLTTTKLKGLISAKNKLTTTWSELKSQN